MKSSEREQRIFYAIFEDEIVQTIGLITQDIDVWWCPSLGYSMWVGSSLFHTKGDATAKLKQDLKDRIDRDKKRLKEVAP